MKDFFYPMDFFSFFYFNRRLNIILWTNFTILSIYLLFSVCCLQTPRHNYSPNHRRRRCNLRLEPSPTQLVPHSSSSSHEDFSLSRLMGVLHHNIIHLNCIGRRVTKTRRPGQIGGGWSLTNFLSHYLVLHLLHYY